MGVAGAETHAAGFGSRSLPSEYTLFLDRNESCRTLTVGASTRTGLRTVVAPATCGEAPLLSNRVLRPT